MDDPLRQRLVAGLYLAWLAVFIIGTAGLARSFIVYYRTLGRTQAMTGTLLNQSLQVAEATQSIRAHNAEAEFLQNLVSLLPQTKSFIRTQRAMEEEVELLREKVGWRIHNDLHILVDTRANKLYVKKGLTLLWEADCSVGKGGMLRDKVTGRRWEFVTPRGQFEVRDKIVAPLWTKPDWAFVEAHERIPPPEDPSRHVAGELGAYVLNLGDGYLIHGTRNEALLGRPMSHGCVRLGAVDLKRLYETVPRGTKVYIY
jgi:L,D-transpeptidase YbiS